MTGFIGLEMLTAAVCSAICKFNSGVELVIHKLCEKADAQRLRQSLRQTQVNQHKGGEAGSQGGSCCMTRQQHWLCTRCFLECLLVLSCTHILCQCVTLLTLVFSVISLFLSVHVVSMLLVIAIFYYNIIVI